MPSLYTPSIGSKIDLQADYLEFSALIKPDGNVPIGDLTGEQDLQWDTEADNDDDRDAVLEEARVSIAEEFARRRHVLESAYPFSVTPDGAVLQLLPEAEWHIGRSSYLLSLVLSHATTSEIVPREVAPADERLRQSQKLFQVCATLAAAGICRGHAYSIGFPRPDGSTFLKKLQEIWVKFGDGKLRREPLKSASPQIKDGGIDVIAWCPQRDNRPGTMYLLAQVASGKNWSTKSVREFIQAFHYNWFETQPISQCTAAMMIPFLISEEGKFADATLRLGHVYHRDRLPREASRAPKLAQEGYTIERLDDMEAVRAWVIAYRKYLQEECQ
jgi:hypothetical protein